MKINKYEDRIMNKINISFVGMKTKKKSLEILFILKVDLRQKLLLLLIK